MESKRERNIREMSNEFQFIDYDESVHKFIDNWRSDDIRRFATEHPLSVEWKYYTDTADYRVGYDVFCKIAVAESKPVAWMIIFCDPAFPIEINPIAVDPHFASQGFGTRILREFIERIDEILPQRGDCIEVGIDVKNIKANRLFERLGFRRKGVHPDGDFEYYVKSLAQPL